MQLLIDILVALAVWSFVVAKIQTIATNNRHTQTTWLFAVFFALTMTFQIDPVYATIGDISGIENIAWLLAFICLVIAVQFLVINAREALGKKAPATFALPTVVIGTITFVFWQGMRYTPLWLDHDIPRTTAEMVFMNVLFVYAMFQTSVFILPTLTHFYQHVDAPIARLRVGALGAAACAAIAYFGAKLLLTWTGTPIWLYISRLTMAVAGLTWPAAFLPTAMLSRGLDYLNNLRRLQDIKTVHSTLSDVCPLVPNHHASRIQYLTEPRLYTLLFVTHILDSRKALALWLARQEEGNAYAYEWLERLHGVLDQRSEESWETIERCRQLKQYT